MKPIVGIIMGSDSDLQVMQAGSDVLHQFGIPHEIRIVSAHRTPSQMLAYAKRARQRGLRVLIAGAGGAAHLPGMVASATSLPVIGVPVQIGKLKGLDALLSIAQMPKGVPVATMAVDNATNAALFVVRILAVGNERLHQKLLAFQAEQQARVKAADRRVRGGGRGQH